MARTGCRTLAALHAIVGNKGSTNILYVSNTQLHGLWQLHCVVERTGVDRHIVLSRLLPDVLGNELAECGVRPCANIVQEILGHHDRCLPVDDLMKSITGTITTLPWCCCGTTTLSLSHRSLITTDICASMTSSPKLSVPGAPAPPGAA